MTLQKRKAGAVAVSSFPFELDGGKHNSATKFAIGRVAAPRHFNCPNRQRPEEAAAERNFQKKPDNKWSRIRDVTACRRLLCLITRDGYLAL